MSAYPTRFSSTILHSSSPLATSCRLVIPTLPFTSPSIMGSIDPKAGAQSHFDVLIVGAGISGVNAAYRIHSELPHYAYAIIESRSSMGGTWDLFRYPGIRLFSSASRKVLSS